ncbi:MAG: response regulator, partial [Spirulinaceae cyanobacterium SM2_1_0]|nr:response regulator [Spirulinaceae cyanobacterium SM2_1_0]
RRHARPPPRATTTGDRLSTERLGLFVPEPTRKPADPAATTPTSTAERPTILVVDDSLTERQTLSLILRRAGYAVRQAKDGLEAMEFLQQGQPVSAILCDIEMPRLNGLEFLSWLKQAPRFRDRPVVMLTSRRRDKFQPLTLEMGAHAYLTKPYLEQEILATLREAVNS